MIYTDFDLNALKIFMAVYENGGIDLASKKLFISQPAVSIAIKKLEDKLGGKLFVRLPKGSRPTEEGTQFYAFVKNGLKQIENGIGEFAIQGDLKGTLHIGASPSIIKLLMPSIAEFCTDFPQLKLEFTEVIASRLQKYLFKGDIDMALMEQPITSPELYEAHTVVTLHPCFVAGSECPKHLSSDQLATQKIATLKPNTNIRALFDKFTQDQNLKIAYEMANSQTLAEFCTHNLALGFTMEEYVTDELEKSKLHKVQIPFMLSPVTLFALLPKGSTGGKMGQKFLDYICKNH